MKKIRKEFALFLVLALALAMTACGGSSNTASTATAAPAATAASDSTGAESAAPAAKNRLEQIKERGYIEVCTEPYWVPMEFIDITKSGDDQYVGVDIELAKYIAERLGVELRIIPLEFSAVLASITEGKYDLAISALAYSPSRAENMNMSVGYRFSGDEGSTYGFLVREEDADKYSTAEDFSDLVLVTQSGSVQESFVNAQIDVKNELKLVSAMPDGYMMVKEGKADACACDVNNGQLFADANGGLAIVPDFRFTVDEESIGTRVGIPLGEDELTDFVNECIAELRAEGKIDAWYDEYVVYARDLGLN